MGVVSANKRLHLTPEAEQFRKSFIKSKVIGSFAIQWKASGAGEPWCYNLDISNVLEKIRGHQNL